MDGKRQNKDDYYIKSRQWFPLEGCAWKIILGGLPRLWQVCLLLLVVTCLSALIIPCIYVLCTFLYMFYDSQCLKE